MSVDSKFLPIKCLLITERKGAALQGGAWLTATREIHPTGHHDKDAV